MSSKPGSSRAPQQAQQEFIARIRYANTLPPPTNPPKLLNIPNDALSLYCDVDFTSKLAREHMTNVEADIEGGMPLDIWGYPGVFDGDDTALLAQDHIPPIHDDDRALLIPLDRIGKKTNAAVLNTNVSFLRRTEYISVRHKTKSYHDSPAPRREVDIPDEEAEREKENDPVRMLAATMTGFDIVYPETAGKKMEDSHMQKAEAEWNKIKPGYRDSKTGKTVVSTLPIFPDASASGDPGYMSIKFNVAPVPSKSEDKRDTRLDVGLFRVNENSMVPSFDYYLPTSEDIVPKIKDAFKDPPPEDLEVGTQENQIVYSRIREYEAAQNVITIPTLGSTEPDICEYVLAFQEEDTDERPRGAYWIPLVSKVVLRPKRNEKVMKSLFRSQHSNQQNEEEEKVEALKVSVRDMNDEERIRRGEMRRDADGDVDADGEADDD